MMTMLLVAGIAVLAAGLLAVGFGIPVKEFSFGNTLILAGAVAACTGLVMLALAVVVRELQNIARRLGPAAAAAPSRASGGQAATASGNRPGSELFSQEPPALEHPDGARPAPEAPPSAG